jgi:hypothetical protein
MCLHAGVRLGIGMKESVFLILVRTNSTDALLQFPCIAHDVLQSQGKEFYNTGIHHLTQHWQKHVKNDEDFVEK